MYSRAGEEYYRDADQGIWEEDGKEMQKKTANNQPDQGNPLSRLLFDLSYGVRKKPLNVPVMAVVQDQVLKQKQDKSSRVTASEWAVR